MNDEPFVSNPNLQTYNAQQKADQMTDYVKHMLEHYQGNHLLIPMGCDFTFANARMNFA